MLIFKLSDCKFSAYLTGHRHKLGFEPSWTLCRCLAISNHFTLLTAILPQSPTKIVQLHSACYWYVFNITMLILCIDHRFLWSQQAAADLYIVSFLFLTCNFETVYFIQIQCSVSAKWIGSSVTTITYYSNIFVPIITVSCDTDYAREFTLVKIEIMYLFRNK